MAFQKVKQGQDKFIHFTQLMRFRVGTMLTLNSLDALAPCQAIDGVRLEGRMFLLRSLAHTDVQLGGKWAETFSAVPVGTL